MDSSEIYIHVLHPTLLTDVHSFIHLYLTYRSLGVGDGSRVCRQNNFLKFMTEITYVIEGEKNTREGQSWSQQFVKGDISFETDLGLYLAFLTSSYNGTNGCRKMASNNLFVLMRVKNTQRKTFSLSLDDPEDPDDPE